MPSVAVLASLLLIVTFAFSHSLDGLFWLLDDQSFEKMGDLMQENHWKLLGLYDELPMFLSQINICRGRGLTESHELAIFLQLYGADPWVRRTGMYYVCMYVDFTVILQMEI